MNTRFSLGLAVAVSTLVTFILFAGYEGARADEPKADAIVTPLVTRDLAGMAGKEVVMLTVEYPPGGASPPHRHDAHVFVYVLDGTLLMQVDGQAPVTLKPGQTFYESPQDIHRTSANASATKPAKFLVFMVKDKAKPTTRAAE